MATEVISRSFPLHGYGDTQQQLPHQPQPTTTRPINIPGRGPSSSNADLSRGRRTQCLLSSSAPANPDAILSRSLMEQCRLDDGRGVNEGALSFGIAGSPRAGLKRAAWSTDSLCTAGACRGNESWKQPSAQLPWPSSSSSSSPSSTSPRGSPSVLMHRTAAQTRRPPPFQSHFTQAVYGPSITVVSPLVSSSEPFYYAKIEPPTIVPWMATHTAKANSMLSPALQTQTSAALEPHKSQPAKTGGFQASDETRINLATLKTMHLREEEAAAAERRRVQNRIAQRNYRKKLRERFQLLEMKFSSVAEEAKKPPSIAVPCLRLPEASLNLPRSPTPFDGKIEASSPTSSDTGSSAISSSTDSAVMNSSPSDAGDENGLGSSQTFTARARASILDRLMEVFYSLPVYDSSPPLREATVSRILSCIDDMDIGIPLADAANGNVSESDCHHDLSSEGAGNGQRNGKRRASRQCSDRPHGDWSQNEDNDDGEDDGDKHPRQKKAKVGDGEPSNKRLACPFFKHNPQRYQEERSCVGPGWRTVHRLKEHIYRCHTLPIHCLRCHEIFASEELLRQHSLADTPCRKMTEASTAKNARSTQPAMEGIGQAQERRLRSRKRSDNTEAEKWAEVWRICFPEEQEVPSPYYDLPTPPTESNSCKGNDSPSELAQYEAFMRAQLPKRVRRELEKRIEQQMAPIEEHLKAQLVDIVRDLQLKLLEEFRKPSGPGTTTNQSSLDTDVTAISSSRSSLEMVRQPSLATSTNLKQTEPAVGKLPESWQAPCAQISSTKESTGYVQEPVATKQSERAPSQNTIPDHACYANTIGHERLDRWHDACTPSQSATHGFNVGGYASYPPAFQEGPTLPFDQHEDYETENWMNFASNTGSLPHEDGFPALYATYAGIDSQAASSMMTTTTSPCSTLASSLASSSASASVSTSTSGNGFVFGPKQQGRNGREEQMARGVARGTSWPDGLDDGPQDSNWYDWPMNEGL